jgi:hypothetical protein
MWRKAVVVLACLALIGCVKYTLVDADRHSIAGLYSVDPQIEWNKTTELGVELWTVNGPMLEALRFVSDVEDGDIIFDVGEEEELPKFRAHMTLSEIVEFVVDSMAVAGATHVEPINARPARFGDAEGIRFELSFQSSEGLEQDGIVVGAVIDEQLYLIMFTGVRVHYFPSYKDHVERLIASIEMT